MVFTFCIYRFHIFINTGKCTFTLGKGKGLLLTQVQGVNKNNNPIEQPYGIHWLAELGHVACVGVIIIIILNYSFAVCLSLFKCGYSTLETHHILNTDVTASQLKPHQVSFMKS